MVDPMLLRATAPLTTCTHVVVQVDHVGLTGDIDRENLPAGVEGMEGGVAPPNRTPCPILVRMFPSISAKKLLCCSLRRATLALLPLRTTG